MDWKTVENGVWWDDKEKWDRKVPANEVRIDNNGILEVKDSGPTECYSLSDLATGQMCQKLGIPVKYYRRLPGEIKSVVANHDLKRLEDHSYLLRGKAEWIRGFLSADYVTYNNSQVAETVAGLLENGAVMVKSFTLVETHMFLKIVSEEIVDAASGLKAGIMISNSEVGCASISVEPFVYRLTCTNDLVVSTEESFRHAHIHLTARELNSRMAEAIGSTFRIASTIMDTFLKAREEAIEDPLETIRQIAEARQFAQKFTDNVVGSYLTEPEPSRFGVINAFTHAAQQLAPVPRIEMERFAGRLLEVPLQ